MLVTDMYKQLTPQIILTDTIQVFSYPGCQRFFLRGFRCQSSCSANGLRPPFPSAAREKPLVPRVVFSKRPKKIYKKPFYISNFKLVFPFLSLPVDIFTEATARLLFLWRCSGSSLRNGRGTKHACCLFSIPLYAPRTDSYSSNKT